MLNRVKEAWKSQWGRVTHTHFHTNTRRKGEKNRLGPGNFLIPISAPVWSVRAPALLGLSNAEPVHMLLQTLRTDVLPWKYSALDFEVFQLSRVVLNLLEAVPESFGRLRNQNFLKLCDPFFFLNIWLALFQKTDAVNLENGRCLIKVLSLGALSMRAQTFGRPPRWDGWWIRWQRLDPGLCVRCYRLHVRRSETGDRGRLTDPGEDAQPEDQTH